MHTEQATDNKLTKTKSAMRWLVPFKPTPKVICSSS